MKLNIILLIIAALISCKQVKENYINDQFEQSNAEFEKKSTLLKINFNKKSIYDVEINESIWSDIKRAGDPDTALTLYAYRILFTEEKEGVKDCEIRYNVLESIERIKELFPTIFYQKSEEVAINSLIDSLNQASITFAKEIVEKDIEKYGKSDGPCNLLYSQKNKLK